MFLFLRTLAYACAIALTIALPVLAKEGKDVHGTVHAQDGTPIAGARVTLNAGTKTYRATSDAQGDFEIKRVPPQTYTLTVAANGYASITGRTVDIEAESKTRLALVMARETTGTLGLIGEVSASGGAQALTTSTSPTVTLSALRAAAAAQTTVAQMLWNVASLTNTMPLGGGGNAPAAFAIRGPDPTESLVEIDGHQVNSGSTGTFDLSLIDPAALQSVQVIYGIAPSSLIGPNTLGGAIDVVTLEPSASPHALARAFGGSFESYGGTLQATGTDDRIGYAFSLHRATSAGEVNQDVNVPCPAGTGSCSEFAGSAFDGTSLLTKLRYALGGTGGYVQASFRDQTVYKNLGALMTSYAAPGGGSDDDNARPTGEPTPPPFTGFPDTSLAAHNAGYGFDAQLPLGERNAENLPATTLAFSHLTSLVSQSVDGGGANTSPYLYNGRDFFNDDWLQIDHHFGAGELSVKADVMAESLVTAFLSGASGDDAVRAPGARKALPSPPPPPAPEPTTVPLAQTQRSVVVRYDGNPSTAFHYSLAAYFSGFSTFGSSFDPRAGIVWTPSGSTSVRASAGTTFQAPQLTSLLVLPVTPPPVNGLVSVGNPNLRPDRATEYDLGIEHLFGSHGDQTRVSVDLYRTNLRTPITQYVPPNVDPNCTKDCPLTYPINVGGQVYQGVQIEAERALRGGLKLDATWSVNSSFLTSIPPYVPLGSSLVLDEQTQGLPLHRASLGIARDVPQGLIYTADVGYQGTYNALNRPPFATLDASVAYRWKHFELGLYGTNLTNVYDDRFTAAGAGVPYGGAGGIPIPANAYVLQGSKILLVLTGHV